MLKISFSVFIYFFIGAGPRLAKKSAEPRAVDPWPPFKTASDRRCFLMNLTKKIQEHPWSATSVLNSNLL